MGTRMSHGRCFHSCFKRRSGWIGACCMNKNKGWVDILRATAFFIVAAAQCYITLTSKNQMFAIESYLYIQD